MDYNSLYDRYLRQKEIIRSLQHTVFIMLIIAVIVLPPLIIWQSHQNEKLKAEITALKTELNQKENK
jgi:hypothetical protein